MLIFCKNSFLKEFNLEHELLNKVPGLNSLGIYLDKEGLSENRYLDMRFVEDKPFFGTELALLSLKQKINVILPLLKQVLSLHIMNIAHSDLYSRNILYDKDLQLIDLGSVTENSPEWFARISII